MDGWMDGWINMLWCYMVFSVVGQQKKYTHVHTAMHYCNDIEETEE